MSSTTSDNLIAQARPDTNTTQTDPPDAAPPTSGITPAAIRDALQARIGATEVLVEDMSGGCGEMYAATIVSPQFSGKGTLARHRLVNGALRAEIAAIHAWTPKCFTPEEWERKGGGGAGGGAVG